MAKELLFSVTAKDCEFTYTRGTGPGGQKRNKTSSAAHCYHAPSGARSYSDITRSQHDNKRDAFLKMINTHEFKRWHKLEIMRRLGTLADIEQHVERELAVNTKVEFREDGKWVDENERVG
jgi:protein subunit release factor B